MESKKQLTILLVDDEALITEGLSTLLRAESFVKEVLHAGNKAECVEMLNKRPDVILLDFKLRDTNGLEMLKAIKAKLPDTKVIVLTGLDGVELVVTLLKAGVDGMNYKLDGYSEIRTTILKVMRGEPYFPERILTIIRKNSSTWDDIPGVNLTFSEKEILRSLMKGLTTKEIAAELRMTEATTETYRNRLMKKVNAPNTAGLLAFAFRNGLL